MKRVAAIGAALGLVLAAYPEPAQAHDHRDPGAIAFISDRDSTADTVIDDVYLLNPRTDQVLRVTNNSDVESFPTVSPDGRTLAYLVIPIVAGVPQLSQVELRTCRLHVGRGELSCTHQQTLVPPAGRVVATSPLTWTNDSRTILYAGYDETTTDVDVFSIRLHGHRTPVNLTQEADGQPLTFDAQPSVAPRDRTFVYSANGDIKRRNLNGTGVVGLTSGPRVDVLPEVSPDGRRLVFQVNAPGDFDIYTMKARSEGPDNPALNLTAGRTEPNGRPTQERFPSWSPDGHRIAYQRHVDYDPTNPFYSGLSTSEIYIMRPDGSGEQNLTNNEGAQPPIGDILPDWGPSPKVRTPRSR